MEKGLIVLAIAYLRQDRLDPYSNTVVFGILMIYFLYGFSCFGPLKTSLTHIGLMIKRLDRKRKYRNKNIIEDVEIGSRNENDALAIKIKLRRIKFWEKEYRFERR